MKRATSLAVLLIVALTSLAVSGILSASPSKAPKGQGGVLIQGVEVVTEQAHPNGRIWGQFHVRVTLKNESDRPIRKVKVLGDHLGNLAYYARTMPDRKSVVAFVGLVAPGQTGTVTLGPFSPFHPETDQEIVVNVVSTMAYPGDVTKVAISTAFPPGSPD